MSAQTHNMVILISSLIAVLLYLVVYSTESSRSRS